MGEAFHHLEGYEFHLRAQGLANKTVHNYMRAARSWLGWCDGHCDDPLKATSRDMLTYLDTRYPGQMQSTRRFHLICLRKLYDYFKLAKLIKQNPARKLDMQKQVARPVEPFTPSELRRMRLACEGPVEVAVFYLLVGGGLRAGEIPSRERDDFNEEHGTLRVFGKGAKYRTIALGQKAVEALKVVFAAQEELIPCAAHDTVYKMVQRWAKAAGLNGRSFPHRFRYTFAVEFSEAGGGIDMLQTLLGHSSLEMSMHYSRKGRERRAVEQMRALDVASRLVG